MIRIIRIHFNQNILRNRIVHDYGHVDLGIVYDTLTQDVSEIRQFIEIDISECETYEQILAVITDWADYYNNERYQWDLAKLAPAEYYKYLKTGKYPLEIPKSNGQK